MEITREHKALVLFFALIICGLGFAFFYITNIGHSWNVAASAIDDMSGELNGYAAILYEGTAEEELNENDAKASSSKKEGKLVASLNEKTNQQSSVEGEVTASQAISDDQNNGEDVFDIQSLKRTYAEKGAAVFTLNLADPSQYFEKTIIKASKYIYGVIAVDSTHFSKAYLDQRIAEYQSAKVDCIIVVTSSFDLIEDYSQITIALSTADEGLSSGGVTSDGTFFNDAALLGQVGTVLVSPSKVVSSKDVSNL